MPKMGFSVEGLRELEQKLKTLEPKKMRNINRRALRKAAEPVETVSLRTSLDMNFYNPNLVFNIS
ncbi:hypothetical protein A0O36_02403 [Piscirickettsiaceae bacterium NZ-RLO1]|nr:hypothetical protein A0O36_02403 [Piscirickettsiaceae bacterium NZ-RLO1]